MDIGWRFPAKVNAQEKVLGNEKNCDHLPESKKDELNRVMSLITLWNLIVEAQNDEQLTLSITLEAADWFEALRLGLEKHDVRGAVFSTLFCRPLGPDGTAVRDVVSKRSFVLRPVSISEGPRESFQGAATAGEGGSFVSHEVFFSRDEASFGGEGIYYRERLIVVKDEISKAEASRLAIEYFEALKAQGDRRGKGFVSVHIYDHEFTKRSKRPPVAALTWREWCDDGPVVFYPLFGEQGVCFSMMRPEDTAFSTRAPVSVEPSAADDVFGDSPMRAAFEAIQGMYSIRDFDEAAAFVLAASRRLIPCEAGRCMSVSFGSDELYVSVAQGEGADACLGRGVSSKKGLVGFLLRHSAVVGISDITDNFRFGGFFDRQEEMYPRSVLYAPIQFEGKAAGVLQLINSERPGGFAREDANVLSYLGTSFAEHAAKLLAWPEAFNGKDGF